MTEQMLNLTSVRANRGTTENLKPFISYARNGVWGERKKLATCGKLNRPITVQRSNVHEWGFI